jgi:hypothetical protein
MIYFYFVAQIMMLFSFIFHSLYILLPGIDELGMFAIFMHLFLMSLSLSLFLLTRDIYKEVKKDEL